MFAADEISTDLPTLRHDGVAAIAVDSPATGVLARQIASMLKAYPHFCILTGGEPTEDPALVQGLCRAVARLDVPHDLSGCGQAPKTSFTRVRIGGKSPPAGGAVTRFSRTNRAMALHTDSTYKATPHQLVAFQMVRSDATGGDTLVVAVEDVMAALGQRRQVRLSQPDYPFGPDRFPILWQVNGAPCIRYYRRQIDAACAVGDRLTWRQRIGLEALDIALRRHVPTYRFGLRPGDILFLHNTKALHGRTGFSADSDRLMYRVRVRADGLD